MNKWFQNHSYNEKKKDKGKSRAVSTASEATSDDEAAVEAHLTELRKELTKKKHNDQDKISRLLSLTFANRRAQMLSQPANARVTSTLQEYPCFKFPLFVS